MTSKGIGKIIVQGKAGTRYISIPSTVAQDSTFPFEDGENIMITVDPSKKRLIINKIECVE